jgi:hypothetical protein
LQGKTRLLAPRLPAWWKKQPPEAENELAAASSANQNQLPAKRVGVQDRLPISALKAKYDTQAATGGKKRENRPTGNQWPDILDPNNLYWFFSGAGVLLAGFFTGYSVKRQRRWSSLG